MASSSTGDEGTKQKGITRTRSRSRCNGQATQRAQDTPTLAKDDDSGTSLTDFWISPSAEGQWWILLYQPVGSADFFGRGRPAGKGEGVLFHGKYPQDGRRCLRYTSSFPEKDDFDVRGMVSPDGKNISATRIKAGKIIGSVSFTRVARDTLSVSRKLIIDSLLHDGTAPQHCDDEYPNIANPYIKDLGFRLALFPPSPRIIVDEVFAGSWGHGIGITPGTECLTINGEEVNQMTPDMLLKYMTIRPLRFTWKKPPPPLLGSVPNLFELYTNAPKAKPSGMLGEDSEADSVHDRTKELENFEGRWQVDMKSGPFGEVEMGRDGFGTLRPKTGKEMSVKLMGEGTSASPFTLNIGHGWTLKEWSPDRRVWVAKTGGKSVWTLLERPADSAEEIRLRDMFRCEVEKDPVEWREAALQLRKAKPGSSLTQVEGRTSLPLRLFLRQEEVAWRWNGKRKPLPKDGVFDMDSSQL